MVANLPLKQKVCFYENVQCLISKFIKVVMDLWSFGLIFTYLILKESIFQASEALHIVIFESFVKSMTSWLLELKVTPSFCFANKIPDVVWY